MEKTDRYLIIFAAGVIALVIVALFATRSQPEPTYLDGDSAEAAAHNYLLALERGDYERAYAYLSPDLKGYPDDALQFARQVRNDRWAFPTEQEATSLTLLSVEQQDQWADAQVRITVNYERGIFGFDRNTQETELRLERTDAGWKIASGDRLFAYCWLRDDCY